MIAIKKILVPTDLSNMSLSAIAYAISLAKKHAAEVSVLHVLPNKAMNESFAPGYVTDELIAPGVLRQFRGASQTGTVLSKETSGLSMTFCTKRSALRFLNQ